MKTWNTPEVKELNINETANGYISSDVEFWFITNNDKSSTPKDETSNEETNKFS